MARLTFQIPLNRPAYCPCCGDSLNDTAVWFTHGIAFCHFCSHAGSHAINTLMLQTIDDHLHHRHTEDWSTAHGLSFWTPQIHLRKENYLKHLAIVDRAPAN